MIKNDDSIIYSRRWKKFCSPKTHTSGIFCTFVTQWDRLRRTPNKTNNQGWVARSMVSANHWLRGIKTYRLLWYLTRVNANHALSIWAQVTFLSRGSLSAYTDFKLKSPSWHGTKSVTSFLSCRIGFFSTNFLQADFLYFVHGQWTKWYHWCQMGTPCPA